MKKVLLTLMVALGIFVLGASVIPHMALAAGPADEICKGAGAAAGGGGCGNGGVDLSKVAQNIVQVFAIIIGIVAVIMIMVGGFKYITSNGDSGSISSAKSTITYALVGLVVAAFAQILVSFVLDRVTK